MEREGITMKIKRILAMMLILSVIVGAVACGKEETKKAIDNKKKEITTQIKVADETSREETGEDVEEKINSKQEKKKTTTTSKNVNGDKSPTSKDTSSNVQKPSTETETEPKVPEHEHSWEREHREYQFIKTYVNGCNGCGYPLFKITANGTQHIEDLYSHSPCYSDKLGGECTGGGFHNESYTRGYCYVCGGKVSYRQCMWTEMGKRCAKNEALGAYKKVTFDQNHFMYLDVCACGRNNVVIDGVTGSGLILKKSTCSICGVSEF